MPIDLDLQCLPLGALQTNCYLLSLVGSDRCIIIDPGGEVEVLLALLRQLKVTPELLLLTHSHYDHIGGVAGVLAAFPELDYAAHPLTVDLVQAPTGTLSIYAGGISITAPPPTRVLADGDTVEAAGLRLGVRFLPGHAPDHLVFTVQGADTLIAGDALFAGSIGRTDFPGCDHGLLMAGLRGLLNDLSDETRVYPGHGPATSIGVERASNPFLQP